MAALEIVFKDKDGKLYKDVLAGSRDELLFGNKEFGGLVTQSIEANIVQGRTAWKARLSKRVSWSQGSGLSLLAWAGKKIN